MASPKHGKNSGAKWNSVDITSVLDTASFDRLIALADATAFSITNPVYTTRVAGAVDLVAAIGGPYDGAVIETSAGMETDWLAGTSRAFKLQQDATGAATTTNPAYTFTAFLENFKLKTSKTAPWTWSADLKIASGTLTRATSGAF